ARARIGESLAVARHSTPIAQCRSHTMMALLHLALGEFDVAAAHAGQSLAIVAERGLNWHFSMTFGVAAEAYRRAGRPADSDRVIRAGMAQAQAVGLPWAEAAANAASDQADRLLKAIAGFAALGHAPELLRALEALAVSAGSRTPTPGDAAEIALLLGGTAANRRRLGIVPFPADAALLAEAPGQLQAALGNREFLQTAERGNSQSLDDLARRVLRMRGARTRPASGWESLTPTELRVAELAASGLRNSEVAARLIVAPGTVKTHLSHVYAKLGVRTRTELAAVCARNQQK
ncbi:MAG TPA: LuxR C-terminal-related transcriptional regulator, partial [Streptosporangiaceae bacterium]